VLERAFQNILALGQKGSKRLSPRLSNGNCEIYDLFIYLFIIIFSLTIVIAKIQLNFDELKKALRAHKKVKENYSRSIHDAEAAIRTRDAAIKDLDAKPISEPSQQEEGFLNRSISKVLT